MEEHYSDPEKGTELIRRDILKLMKLASMSNTYNTKAHNPKFEKALKSDSKNPYPFYDSLFTLE